MIEERIKEKFNIKNIKLVDAVYKKEDKICYLSFLVDCVLGENEKESIAKFCEQFLNSKVKVNFKRAIYDDEAVLYIIRNFLKEKYSNVFQMLDENDISILKADDGVIIKFKLFEEMKVLIEKNGFASSIISKLSNHFFENFSVEIEKKEINNLEIIIDEMERGRELAQPEKKQDPIIKIKTDEISLHIGEQINDVAIAISCVKKPTDSVCVAGKVCFFSKKTFKKKLKNGEIEEKPFYTFVLDDTTSKINCTYFPTKQTEAKMEKIVDGTLLVCSGGVELFNDRLSFRPKNISLCMSFEPIQKKIEYLPVPEEYKCIFPKPFSNAKQLNLLGEDVAQLNENEFLKNTDVVVFDLETTGLYFEKDEIIEIGACKIENGVITQTFETLIKPQMLIPEEATKINNITNEMVENCPSFDQVIGDFYKFCNGCVMVAYNAGFDKGFIDYYAEKCRYKFTNKVIDAMMVAKDQLKGLKSYKLKTVLEKLGIVNEGAHRAVHDAIATAKAFIVLSSKL